MLLLSLFFFSTFPTTNTKHTHTHTHIQKYRIKKSESERYKSLELNLSEATRKAKKEIKRLSDLSQGQEALVVALESEKGDLLAQIEIGVKRAEKDLGTIRKLEQQLNTSRAQQRWIRNVTRNKDRTVSIDFQVSVVADPIQIEDVTAVAVSDRCQTVEVEMD